MFTVNITEEQYPKVGRRKITKKKQKYYFKMFHQKRVEIVRSNDSSKS